MACPQVQNLSSTISVEQRFLSPESAARLGDIGTGPPGVARWLQAQVGDIWGPGTGVSRVAAWC